MRLFVSIPTSFVKSRWYRPTTHSRSVARPSTKPANARNVSPKRTSLRTLVNSLYYRATNRTFPLRAISKFSFLHRSVTIVLLRFHLEAIVHLFSSTITDFTLDDQSEYNQGDRCSVLSLAQLSNSQTFWDSGFSNMGQDFPGVMHVTVRFRTPFPHVTEH